VTNDLTGKATTKTPITVTTDPNTHVDLLDKDNQHEYLDPLSP
jgi:hypothetical protein